MNQSPSSLSTTWSAPMESVEADTGFRGFTPRNAFEALWFFSVPITSVVMLPAVKGTTPAAILGLLSFALAAVLFTGRLARYYKLVIGSGALFLLSLAASFVACEIAPPPLGGVILVQDTSLLPSGNLRLSTLTQTLYLAAAASVFFWTYCFRSRSIETAFAWGMWFLIAFGWMEWIGFLATGTSMDFLSNRAFGEGLEHSGSLFQTTNILGLTVQRFKSLTGEPSMFALVALPAVPFFFSIRRRILALACILSLLVTFSTIAYLGLALMAVIFVFRGGFRYWPYMMLIALLAVAAVPMYDKVEPVLTGMFTEKIEGHTQSGRERQGSFERTFRYAKEAHPAVLLFGAGFGVSREYSLLCTLLINTGILGVLIFCAAFLIPAAILILRGRENLGLGISLLLIFVCFSIAVPEFSYPSSWLFLGLAWRQLLQSRFSEDVIV